MTIRFLIVFVLLLAALPTSKSLAEDQFQQLFNGKDLSGWDGKKEFWSVKDGVIFGETTKANPVSGNTFLVWQGGEVADFVFKAKVRFQGNNTGVQYRSELIDADEFVVKGYQADLHKSPNYFGMLYAEKWRGIVAKRFQKVVVGADGKPKVVGEVGDRNQKLVDSQWNELTIIAVGDRQIHQVNGITTMDVTDNHPEAKRKGILALQLHRGPAMTVEFKDIQLKHLSGEDAKATINAAINNQKKAKAAVEENAAPKNARSKTRNKKQDWVSEKPVPKWIWRADDPTGNSPLYLRHKFNVGAKQKFGSIKSAKLYVTCDNQASVWLNGQQVASCTDWASPVMLPDVKRTLKAGANQVSVEASNQGGVAAFLFKLVVEYQSGEKRSVISHRKWKLSNDSAPSWQKIDFDDSSWNANVSNLGDFGCEPWGKPIVGDSKTKKSSRLTVAKGFKVERIYAVPKSEQGSWVSLTADDRGNFYASDQGETGLFRFTVTEPVSSSDTAKPIVEVEKMPVDVSGAQGMVWHDGALYLNRGSSPLFRLTDSTGDGRLDHSEELTRASGGGEHGNHAVILAEDGKHFYVDAGNHTKLPEASEVSRSRVPTWDEDLLLPREWDANGHARGKLAPGGWITKFDAESKKHEIYSIGYRNQYDITLNRAGDLFTYDADMEWDLGAPWYRPTRIVHAVSGSDFGWRSGSGKWPEYYEDSLPPVLNIGPGSPTGVVSGRGTKFPAKYQDAIFALDWTFGVIYAVHLTPDGAGWSGQQEAFCTGAPLPVTDATVGADGALYFATGGRGTDSFVYRITYVGDESTAPVSAAIPGGEQRELRRSLEAFHGRENPTAIDKAWPHLASKDRWLRHAARIAVESQPVDQWAEKLFAETDLQTKISGAVALARSADPSFRDPQLSALLGIDPDQLDDAQFLGLLRAYALTFIRLGEPSNQQREQSISRLGKYLPHENKNINTELVRVLVYLKDPEVIRKTIALLDDATPTRPFWAEDIDFASNPRYGSRIRKVLENQPPSHEINYAFMLRNLKEGWTMDQRRRYITFINRSAKFKGGNSYGKFMANLRNEFLSHMSNEQRAALADISSENFNPVPSFKITPPKGPGKKWTLGEAMTLSDPGLLAEASFESGRNLFHSIKCGTCHRFDGLGGGVGPDLTTVKNKFDAKYLIESIIEPSKVISDQYGSKTVYLEDGRTLTGLIVEKEDKVEIYPLQDAAAQVDPVIVDADEIEATKESSVSQMPAGLLDSMNKDEVRDLLAYLLSSGDRKARVYRKR